MKKLKIFALITLIIFLSLDCSPSSFGSDIKNSDIKIPILALGTSITLPNITISDTNDDFTQQSFRVNDLKNEYDSKKDGCTYIYGSSCLSIFFLKNSTLRFVYYKLKSKNGRIIADGISSKYFIYIRNIHHKYLFYTDNCNNLWYCDLSNGVVKEITEKNKYFSVLPCTPDNYFPGNYAVILEFNPKDYSKSYPGYLINLSNLKKVKLPSDISSNSYTDLVCINSNYLYYTSARDKINWSLYKVKIDFNKVNLPLKIYDISRDLTDSLFLKNRYLIFNTGSLKNFTILDLSTDRKILNVSNYCKYIVSSDNKKVYYYYMDNHKTIYINCLELDKSISKPIFSGKVNGEDILGTTPKPNLNDGQLEFTTDRNWGMLGYDTYTYTINVDGSGLTLVDYHEVPQN